MMMRICSKVEKISRKALFVFFGMFILIMLFSPPAYAKIAGISGRSGMTGPTCISGACHTGLYGVQPTMTINGPTTVAVGETNTYTVEMVQPSPPNNVRGGLNVATTGGTLAAGSNTQLLNSQITHPSGCTANSTGTITWDFTWTAPSTGGTYYMYAAVNATDGNTGNFANDNGNNSSMPITVLSGPTPTTLPPTTAFNDSVAGNFNNSGPLDLAIADKNSGDIKVRTDVVPSGYTNEILTPTSRQPISITTAGDCNADGNQDVATVNQDTDTVSVWLGNGTGSFTLSGEYSVVGLTGLTSITSGDFDGDGDVDLAVTSLDDHKLLDGLGGCTFSGVTVPVITTTTIFGATTTTTTTRPPTTTTSSTERPITPTTTTSTTERSTTTTGPTTTTVRPTTTTTTTERATTTTGPTTSTTERPTTTTTTTERVTTTTSPTTTTVRPTTTTTTTERATTTTGPTTSTTERPTTTTGPTTSTTERPTTTTTTTERVTTTTSPTTTTTVP